MLFNSTTVTDILLHNVDDEIDVDVDIMTIANMLMPAFSLFVKHRSVQSTDEAFIFNVIKQFLTRYSRVKNGVDDRGRKYAHEYQLNQHIKANIVEVDRPVVCFACMN